jgi:hypothetical protein
LPRYTGQSELILRATNRFENDDKQSYAGLLLNDVNFFHINPIAPVPASQQAQTKFSKLRNAIIANRTNLVVNKITVSNMIIDPSYSSIPFFASGKGIWIDGNTSRIGAAPILSIVNSDISGVTYGVMSQNMSAITSFKNNSISSSLGGIYSTNTSPNILEGNIGELGVGNGNTFNGGTKSVGIYIGDYNLSLLPNKLSIVNNTFNQNGQDAIGIYNRVNALVIDKNTIIGNYQPQPPTPTPLGGLAAGGRILLNNSQFARVSANTITLARGFILNGALALDGSLRTQVKSNMITFPLPTAYNNRTSKGIAITNSKGNWLCDNKVFNGRVGVQIMGESGTGNQIPTKIMGTFLRNNSIGIGFVAYGNTGNQINFANDYGTGSNGKNADADNGCVTFNPSSTFTETYSTFTLTSRPALSTICSPNPSAWFRQATTGIPDRLCDARETNAPLIKTWELQPTDEAIATGSDNPSNALGIGTLWTQQQDLYVRLKEHSELLGKNKLIDAFFMSSQDGSIGQLYEISHGLSNLYFQNENIKTLFFLLDSSKNVLISKIANLDTSLINPTSGIVNHVLVVQRENLLSQLGLVSDQLSHISEDLNANMHNQAARYLDLNANIPVSKEYEVIEQSVNDVYLKYMLSNDHILTDVQKSIIRVAAAQCPVSGGTGVYRARAIQQVFENMTYDNEELCTTENTKGYFRKSMITGNFIFPNPTDGDITVVIKNPATANTKFTVSNIFGQIVFERDLQEGQAQFNFNLDNLGQGLFICNITHGFVNLYAQRLVITK